MNNPDLSQFRTLKYYLCTIGLWPLHCKNKNWSTKWSIKIYCPEYTALIIIMYNLSIPDSLLSGRVDISALINVFHFLNGTQNKSDRHFFYILLFSNSGNKVSYNLFAANGIVGICTYTIINNNLNKCRWL